MELTCVCLVPSAGEQCPVLLPGLLLVSKPCGHRVDTLCFLTQNYRHAYNLIQKFGDLEVTVDFLMDLLDVENNPYLIKALYGMLMLLPQSLPASLPPPVLDESKPVSIKRPAYAHMDYNDLL
ncbi:unnamed protein product [Coregonus sp. 'balchen']|nr:unnamed protein product [Coregonus sp. 'balchen']